ncbi:MAG: molybdopterin-dependent oxidoreductase [Halioglobus sp.]|nr:molybdopterin-dependent oxidoreductase [Halioglobus sp.]
MEMKFNGEFKVAIPRQEAFDLLSDPQKFAPLLPTFHSMSMKDDKTATVKVKVGIGKIHGVAATELTLEEAQEPLRAEYVGRGKVMGGAYNMIAGFDLEEAGSDTLIKWRGETQMYGKILSLAGGSMRGYAESEINRLIGSLQLALSPEAEAAAIVAARQAAKPQGLWQKLLALFGLWSPPLPAAPAREVASKEEPAAAVRLLAKPPTRKVLKADVAPAALSRTEVGESIEMDRHGNPTWVGSHLRRKEDSRLVRGRGLYVDDYQSSDMLHLAVVRSPYAHAKILSIDVSEAEALPGVITTLTGAEIASVMQPYMQIGPEPGANIKDYPMAVTKTIYQGEPVVAVVAETARIAADAAELVNVDYEALEPVTSAEDAQHDKSIIHPDMGTNHNWHGIFEYGDLDQAFAEAAHVVKIDRLHFHRFSSTPLETNACVATWDKRGDIDFFTTNTFPAIAMQMMAPALGVSLDNIRCRTHDIGGSFGNKITSYPGMTIAALASRKLGGRQVKWIETRNENLLAGGHGGERTFLDTEVALDADGVITAIRSRHLDDCGAFPRYEPLGCAIWSQVLPATMKLRNIRVDFNQYITNKCPAVPNRGYSRLQHLWFMERVLDICGHQLGMEPDEIRRRNYITEFPYTTPNGCVYDSGDYLKMLKTAQDLLGWDEWKEKQRQARAEGRWLGIGIGTTLDSGSNNFAQAQIVNPDAPFSGNSEVCTLKVGLDGSIVAALGTVPSGQGHETATAQVVADVLKGVGPDLIHVHAGTDTARNAYSGHSGTYASQFAVTGLSAVHGAAVKLRKELLAVGAYALQASEDELEFGEGEMGAQLSVPGTDKVIPFMYLSNIINTNNAGLPPELDEVTLNVRHVFRPKFEVPDLKRKYGNLTLTYAAQLHIAVVEIDKYTFVPQILDYVVVDDCGTQINPKIVEGQVHGATAHGLGAALMEQYLYDASGNLLTSSFSDYTPITAMNMPDLKCASQESPSPFSYNGAKGCGEGGGAPLHTLSAAIQDALAGEDVVVGDTFGSPTAIYDLLHGKGRRTTVTHESRSAA